ncbi:hypothetical protein F0562_003495 [Nyssa sinensis]|uniref:Complex 1 LYR protein domain-containing protein n=1 Tax=Nyssa sinensis TaxID=561372 RepID=A0A5J5BWN9_9ASTE|nr:hypothetical protein F0562_003495 [Nyssa sinensis]
MGASSGPKLSGMQKQVLSLYRGFFRAARSKSPEDRRQIESLVSAEFHRNSNLVDRKNFLYIEYLLRRVSMDTRLVTKIVIRINIIMLAHKPGRKERTEESEALAKRD